MIEDAGGDHRISLGKEWALWRRVGLRSAGFPAALVRRMSAPDCTAAACELFAAEEALAAARSAVGVYLAELAQQEASQAPEVIALLRRVRRALSKGRAHPVLAELAPEAAAALTTAADHLNAARRAYARSYEEALERQSRELAQLVRMDCLWTAILWQNRKVFHDGLAKLAQESGPRNESRRQRERLLANYLQRYTAKNDTIGAFGPSGWARLVDESLGTRVRPGASLIASRSVYLESWCLQELAKTLSREPAARPDLLPLRKPFVRLQGDLLLLPLQRPVRLQPLRAAVLTACDGTRTAREIAAGLLGDPRLGLRAEADVYQLLEHLRSADLIDWGFQVPIHPEAAALLQRQIEGIQEDGARNAGLAALAELESARRALAAAADPDALDRALAEIESTFSRLTGARPERNSGMTYGGRTLVYEDCRRDVEVELGPEVYRALAEPLELVLQSARWLTAEAARQVQKALLPIYRSLSPGGASPVEMADFWPRLLSVEAAMVGRLDGAVRGLHERWQQILGVDPAAPRATFRAAELRDRVLAAFAAPAPGWPLARLHNPDVMIAARNVDDLRRGELQLVLGEMHLAACSLNVWALLSECADRQQVFADLDAEFPAPRVVFLEPRGIPGLTARTRRAHFSPRDILIAPLEGEEPVPGRTAVPLGELLLRESGGTLQVTSRDGRFEVPLLDFLGDLLTVRTANRFNLLAPQRHMPRISFDRLVVCRESWSFPPDEIGFARTTEGAQRFLEAQRWARAHGLPRTVFVRVPIEQKPFYVDFDSPVYVDNLAHVLRRMQAGAGGRPVRFTEMLPGAEEVWLPDAEGQLYTSELRLLAVDLSPFAQSQVQEAGESSSGAGTRRVPAEKPL